MKNENLDNKKFWLAVFLCVSGVSLMFVSLLTTGTIGGGVLGASGELLLTAGAILGIDAAYASKLREIISEQHKEEKQ